MSGDAREITLALRGRWFGRYGLCFCPAHANTRTPALRVAEGRDGRLLLLCSAGCCFADVLAALRGMGLVDGNGRAPEPDPAAEARRKAEERRERERGIRRARNAWGEAGSIGGTLGERYLRDRAIQCDLPGSLRFSGEAWHGPTARRLPAMVAAVTLEGEREPVAVHRTYIAEPGRKADVSPVKAMLGPCRGGAVRLSVGAGPLVIAEGVETALSLRDALAAHDPRVRAALSTSGIAGLRLPPEPGELVIAPDGDGPGRAAADTLARRAQALGWAVSLMPCPDGRDFNDIAMEAAYERA